MATEDEHAPVETDQQPEAPPDRRRLWLLVGLVLAGVAVAFWEPIPLDKALAWGAHLADKPLTALFLVLLQTVLLAIALPGTLVLWLVAPFYHPAVATALLTLGSTAGGLAAYFIARRLGGGWRPPDKGRRTMRLMARHGDFATLLALRVLPGFPHSVVNYGAGTLRLPLVSFTLATVLGLLVKWGVYSTAIHGLAEAGAKGEPPGIDALLPLLVLAVLFAFGGAVRRLIEQRRSRHDKPGGSP